MAVRVPKVDEGALIGAWNSVHLQLVIQYLQLQEQRRVGARLMHSIQVDDVVLALAEHQDCNLVLDLLVAALCASASL